MPVRILTVGNLYPPHHFGGYELMWRSAVHRMRKRGHEVTVLTTDHRATKPDPSIPEDPAVHRELRWYWHEHAFPRRGLRERHRLERHNLATLERHLNRSRADIVNWWAMGGMSMSLIEAVRRRGLPAVGVVVDDWLAYGPEVDAWHRRARRLAPVRSIAERLSGVPARVDLDGAAQWIFVSEATRRRARAAGREPRRSDVEHAGVDPELFRAAAEEPWRWRLLNVGRIDPRKGVLTAVRALAELPADATLEIVGDGDEAHRRELGAEAEELGLGNRVRFAARPRDELPSTYASADAVLFPVLWEEPFGLVPLESMSVGRPVVATGAGGSAEYLRDGENALLYRPREDPAALAAAVRRLAEDAKLRRHLREGGFVTAARLTEARFNDAIVDALEEQAR